MVATPFFLNFQTHFYILFGSPSSSWSRLRHHEGCLILIKRIHLYLVISWIRI